MEMYNYLTHVEIERENWKFFTIETFIEKLVGMR